MTLVIILITVLVSFAAFNNNDLRSKLYFNAYLIANRRQWYRMFSHGLIHADWIHLAFNMLALFSFGNIVTSHFTYFFGAIEGNALFLFIYVASLFLSSAFDLLKHKNNHWYNALGASGAVSAIVFASILIDPWISITIFPIPLPIPGIVFGPLFLIFSQYMSKKGGDNIGHNAHFYGALSGVVLCFLIRPAFLVEFIDKIINH
jgi:membrane associated rhomboid family serine protease